MLIAAVAKNGVIGWKGEIPWYLPSDFAFFKNITINKPIIMGRKTFESIGKPLVKRTNIIISKQNKYQPEGAIVVNSLEEAIKRAKSIAKSTKQKEIMIIGGATIYEQAMSIADRLYISHVDLTPRGDSFFPKIEKAKWPFQKEIAIRKSAKDNAEYKVIEYSRKS